MTTQQLILADRLIEQARQVANAKPSSMNDDLYQWAIDAAEMLYDLAAALEQRAEVVGELPPLPTTDELALFARDLCRSGDLNWAGFRKDELGMYTIPSVSPSVEKLVFYFAQHYARAALAQQARPQWRTIDSAPKDGTNVLLRFGIDGVSLGHYTPGLPHPWKFVDTNDGITWLINRAIDGLGGPTHWMPLPEAPK